MYRVWADLERQNIRSTLIALIRYDFGQKPEKKIPEIRASTPVSLLLRIMAFMHLKKILLSLNDDLTNSMQNNYKETVHVTGLRFPNDDDKSGINLICTQDKK